MENLVILLFHAQEDHNTPIHQKTVRIPSLDTSDSQMDYEGWFQGRLCGCEYDNVALKAKKY